MQSNPNPANTNRAALNATPANTVQPDDNGDCTLVNGRTYLFAVGSSEAPLPAEVPLTSIHLRWDAAVIVTFTIETCNFPAKKPGVLGDVGPDDVTDVDATAGNWIQENPSGVYVGTVGAGVTVTNLTIAVAGGAAGGAMIHLGNLGSRRVRVKAVVGGTGGKVRCNVRGKEA